MVFVVSQEQLVLTGACEGSEAAGCEKTCSSAAAPGCLQRCWGRGLGQGRAWGRELGQEPAACAPVVDPVALRR